MQHNTENELNGMNENYTMNIDENDVFCQTNQFGADLRIYCLLLFALWIIIDSIRMALTNNNSKLPIRNVELCFWYWIGILCFICF